MVAAVQIESPAITMANLAREALEDCGHNRSQATAMMLRWLRNDEDLFKRVVWHCVEESCEGEVANVDSSTRRTLRMVAIRSAPDHPSQKRAQATPKATPAQLMAVQERQDADPDFHQWPLPGGMPLGQATCADVLLGAKFYGESAHTSRVNQRFLELVYEAMQGGTCVGKVLSHAALLRLRRQAEEE